MRLPVFVLAVTTLAAGVGVKDFSKIVPLDGKGRFTLDTYKGSIRITAWDQPQAEIKARIEPDGWHSLPADDVEIRVEAITGDVHVTTDYHRHFGDNNLPLVYYTIRLPRGANLRIKDYKSESQISGVQGDLEFETYKGTAHIDGIQGSFNLDTYKGDIRAIFARFTGPSRINTYRGNIEVSLPKSSSFDLRADLERRTDFDCDFARTIHSMNNLRTIDGTVNGGGAALHVHSYRGNIHLRSI
jgi:Putative adhesin